MDNQIPIKHSPDVSTKKINE